MVVLSVGMLCPPQTLLPRGVTAGGHRMNDVMRREASQSTSTPGGKLSPLVRRLKERPDAWKIWKYTMSVIVTVYFFAHFRSTVFRCKYCKDSHLYKKITFG